MPTAASVLVADVRSRINAETDQTWSDALILRLLNLAAKDLWRKTNELYADYYFTEDKTNMSLAASTVTGAGSVVGVPSDLYKIRYIEPRVIGRSSANPGLRFKPAAWNSDKFAVARAIGPITPRHAVIYYTLVTQGAPVAAPAIRFAPQVNAEVLLSVSYNPSLTAMTLSPDTSNPIPGESDAALIAWATAYALGKQNQDGTTSPDAGWIGIYATEKANLVKDLTPRQTQAPPMVEGMFEPPSDEDGDLNPDGWAGY